MAAWQVPRLCCCANEPRYPPHRFKRRGHSMYGINTMHCPPLRPVRVNSTATELRMLRMAAIQMDLSLLRCPLGEQLTGRDTHQARCEHPDLFRAWLCRRRSALSLEINPRVLCRCALRRPTRAPACMLQVLAAAKEGRLVRGRMALLPRTALSVPTGQACGSWPVALWTTCGPRLPAYRPACLLTYSAIDLSDATDMCYMRRETSRPMILDPPDRISSLIVR